MNTENQGGSKKVSGWWALPVLFVLAVTVAAYLSAPSKEEGILYVFVILAIFAVVGFAIEATRTIVIWAAIIGGSVFLLGIGGYEGYGFYQSHRPTPTPVVCTDIQPLQVTSAEAYLVPSNAITVNVQVIGGVQVVQELFPGQQYWLEVGSYVYTYDKGCRGYLDSIYYPLVLANGGRVIARISPTQTPTVVPTQTAIPTATETELPPQP